MKIAFTFIPFALISFVTWQGFKLRQTSTIQNDPVAQTTPPNTLSKSPKSLYSNVPMPDLPKDLTSITDHQKLLTDLVSLEDPIYKALAAEHWVSSLTTRETLQAALQGLLSAPTEEKELLLRSFGPALLSQWGRIDPADGILAWSKLDPTERALMVNESSLKSSNVFRSTNPDPLVDSWVAEDPEKFYKAITEREELFFSKEYSKQFHEAGLEIDGADLYRRFARQEDTTNLIRRLDLLEENLKDFKPSYPSEVTPDRQLVPRYAMATIISEKLISQHGTVADALEAARTLPSSPGRDRIVMDLATSNLYTQVIREAEHSGTEPTISPELKNQFMESFLGAGSAGQEQVLSTASMHSLNLAKPENSAQFPWSIYRELHEIIKSK